MLRTTRVFSFMNATAAKQFIGEYGFFANSINDLRFNIKDNSYKKLDLVIDDDSCNISAVFVSNDNQFYGLFCPLKYTTGEPIKSFRPFKNIGELQKVTEIDVGSIVTLRDLYNTNHIFKALITAIDDKGIQISNNHYSINDLYRKFEYYFKNTWFRFGVKEYKL